MPVVIPILEAGARTGVSTTDPRAGIGIGENGDPMFTLQSGKQHGVFSVGLGSDVLAADDLAQPITNRNGDLGCIAFQSNLGTHGGGIEEECPTTLKSTQGPPAIGFYANDSGNDAGFNVSPTLRSMEGGGGNHPASRGLH